ncbi:MAG: hypothetical protein CVU41_14510 [Chloroflexi bacterium HGW-Chloroflexi-3]|nr:MAG: hypothetical protein CVU41_14510 [Chloroflexi bacterium HGW-Chloroflexi-3]
MKTIRRFYFYLLSLISVQVVIWAVVNLLRTIFDRSTVTFAVDWLAGGIAFVAVGVPIFWLHWTTVQRDAHREEEEACSRIRGLYLYATPLATGIPITYAVLAILNRLFVKWMGLPVTTSAVGGAQTNIDNLIAIAANLIVLVYFWRVLQQDWKINPNHENLMDFSRLHRYIWMVYGLGLLIFGVQQILRFIFSVPQDFGSVPEMVLATGLALIPVGLPIFGKAWLVIQKSLSEKNESRSSLRLVVLFVLTLLGVGFSLSVLGILLANVFRWIFQVDSWRLISFMDQFATQWAVLITMGLVWGYFRRELKFAITDQDDIFHQAGIHRIYHSILSFAGLVVSFLGLLLLLGTIIESIFNLSIGNNAASLSDALALLLIGLPLWLIYWQQIQLETTGFDEMGTAARTSLLRKAYLYLALFATVVGAMLSTGWWIYGILNALLGQMPSDFWLNFNLQLRIAILFAIFLVYHLRILRADGRGAQPAKEAERSEFSVLVLPSEDSSVSNQLVKAIQLKSPDLPVSILQMELTKSLDAINLARLLLIPSSLLTNPSEELQMVLQNYTGKILVIPEEQENWHWLGTVSRDQKLLMQEVAITVQQLSENKTPRTSAPSNPWMIVAYILAGLFLLEIVLLIITALVNLFLV